jgi:urease accessory protein
MTPPCGNIVCEVVNGRSVLTRTYCHAPLKLLTPSHIGRAASVVMSSFGGGLVSGDDVPLSIHVGPGAACVLSTQSSGKAYKSDGRLCAQSTTAVIENHALLAVLPDPLACFKDAKLNQSFNFSLSQSANLVWLDWLTSGRHACDERWAFDSLVSLANVRVDHQLLLRESLRLDASMSPVAGPMRTGHFNCYAILVVVGPALRNMIDIVFNTPLMDVLSPDTKILMSSARLGSADMTDGVILRLLASDVQNAETILRPLIALLAGVIGENPWARRH